jgi:hypothetical protein
VRSERRRREALSVVLHRRHRPLDQPSYRTWLSHRSSKGMRLGSLPLMTAPRHESHRSIAGDAEGHGRRRASRRITSSSSTRKSKSSRSTRVSFQPTCAGCEDVDLAQSLTGVNPETMISSPRSNSWSWSTRSASARTSAREGSDCHSDSLIAHGALDSRPRPRISEVA